MSVASTPAEVNAFRLISVRGMLRLESMGMKTRGGALRPRLAKEFGLSPRAPYTEYIQYINDRLAEIRGEASHA